MDSSLGFWDTSYCMVPGELFGSMDFQDSAKVCIEHLVHGMVVVILREPALCSKDHLTYKKCFHSKCRNSPHATGTSFKTLGLLILSRVTPGMFLQALILLLSSL